MVRFLQDPGGEIPVGAGPPPQGPLLTLRDLAALQQAPKRQPGTEVTVYAKPVREAGDWADHMFEEFDDGAHQYIYRGGLHFPLLHAQVDPAAQSPDYGQATRSLHRSFLPGVSAEQAIRPAQADAARINREQPLYGFRWSNSNSVIGGFTKSQYGRRVGDDRTWGYDSGLATIPFPIDPLAPTT